MIKHYKQSISVFEKKFKYWPNSEIGKQQVSIKWLRIGHNNRTHLKKKQENPIFSPSNQLSNTSKLTVRHTIIGKEKKALTKSACNLNQIQHNLDQTFPQTNI